MKKKENIRKKIAEAVAIMPFFRIENLTTICDDKRYLKILLSRMYEKGSLLRIKRGLYVSAAYLNDIRIKGKSNDYFEYLACQIYEPSYLSSEYVLSGFGVLPESVQGFSLVSLKKTNVIKNNFGAFFYRTIKEKLFTGYEIESRAGFLIRRASLAKALFDFLYFRKNILVDSLSVKELRLNFDSFKKKDWREFEKYIKLEKSKKMLEISKSLHKKAHFSKNSQFPA